MLCKKIIIEALRIIRLKYLYVARCTMLDVRMVLAPQKVIFGQIYVKCIAVIYVEDCYDMEAIVDKLPCQCS